MENVLVEQPVQYRCGRTLDKDGLIACRGILVFKPGELLARCEECCVWVSIAAPHITLMAVQTGAATGAASKWTVSMERGWSSSRAALTLECGVKDCHFKRHLEATRVHASGISVIMNEHPCPQPPPDSEPVPEAVSRECGNC